MMTDFQVRQLGRDDATALAACVAVEHRFEEALSASPSAPVSEATLGRFLADPAVLFWLAEADDGKPIGMLHCFVQRCYSTGPWAELLLYDMGVDLDWRRRGIGRGLVRAMEEWMAAHGVAEVWVPAAPTAVEFYAACGYETDEGTIMVKTM